MAVYIVKHPLQANGLEVVDTYDLSTLANVGVDASSGTNVPAVWIVEDRSQLPRNRLMVCVQSDTDLDGILRPYGSGSFDYVGSVVITPVTWHVLDGGLI